MLLHTYTDGHLPTIFHTNKQRLLNTHTHAYIRKHIHTQNLTHTFRYSETPTHMPSLTSF